MINKFYGDLGKMAFDYTLSELREHEKEIIVDGVVEKLESKVVERIKEEVDFELSDNDIAEICCGVEAAIAFYLFS